MSGAIAELRAATAEEWDAALATCPHATFFHSRTWAEVLSEALSAPLRPDPRLVVFDDGRRALLPLSLSDRTAHSSPAGTYGGWLADGPLSGAQAGSLADVLNGIHPYLSWRINPFDADQLAVAPAAAIPDTTQALPLAGDFDSVLRRWRKGHRAAVRQAEREGVEVRRAKDEDDWRAYFEVYDETLLRWGRQATSRYPWSLFGALARCPDPGIELWVAEHAERIVAGALCLAVGRHVSYWHGAAREEAFPLRPVHLLVRTAAREAQTAGRTWFDFNPSGGHAGVAAFKSHFGAVSLPCPFALRAPRPGWLRRGWRHLRAAAGR